MIVQTKHAEKGTQNSVEFFPNSKYVDMAKYVLTYTDKILIPRVK